jgi:hypothetical protein
MSIKYTIEYYLDKKSYEGKVKDLEGLKTYLEECGNFTHSGYLEEEIYEYLWQKDPEELVDPIDKEIINSVDGIDISNMEELVEQFRYLIREPICCDQAPWGSRYCPTCGKKLK